MQSSYPEKGCSEHNVVGAELRNGAEEQEAPVNQQEGKQTKACLEKLRAWDKQTPADEGCPQLAAAMANQSF